MGASLIRCYYAAQLSSSTQRELMRKSVGGRSCAMNENLVIHSDGRLLHCCATMASHQGGLDFLTDPREKLVGFKDSPNEHCGECLAKGWAGFIMPGKTDEDLAPETLARRG